jgi:hypothetical protein
MNPGFYQDLTGRLYGLLIVLEHRLNCDDTSVIYQFTGARHDALALEQIARAAAHREIVITLREHGGILVLARANQASSASEFVRELVAHG